VSGDILDAGVVDQGEVNGPCVVCGRPTVEAVWPMGVISEPIWCCHEHEDRSIVRGWIHHLPEWQHLQAEFPSNCRTCSRACHCGQPVEPAPGHLCACWPPLDHGTAALPAEASA
jgi:hypothetical protein